jgi:hypothetical protein
MPHCTDPEVIAVKQIIPEPYMSGRREESYEAAFLRRFGGADLEVDGPKPMARAASLAMVFC